jgi:uncharacterized surface protein with fasciclin (FAS1) repeats
MKKIILSCLLLLNVLFVFGQQADTIKNPGKVQMIEGKMISSPKSLLSSLSASDEFSILVKAIKAAELTSSFDGNSLVTFFAPTDKAFEKLAPGKLDTLLLPAHQAELAALIQYHAVAGRITSKDIAKLIKAGNGKATLTTLSGATIAASINENRNIVLTDEKGGQSIISRLDIQQSNGLLDVVTAVLMPQSK